MDKKKAREFWISEKIEDEDYPLDVSRFPFGFDQGFEDIHVREVIPGQEDLAPGIAWAIEKLKYTGSVNGWGDPNDDDFTDAQDFLRDEARKFGIEVK